MNPMSPSNLFEEKHVLSCWAPLLPPVWPELKKISVGAARADSDLARLGSKDKGVEEHEGKNPAARAVVFARSTQTISNSSPTV
ncbi:hypothetical protein NQZ68_012913 [Dissostichus eleginoides]|nr:hypothetical protein NQZ68_012913 [Dissostichus eleginoides]